MTARPVRLLTPGIKLAPSAGMDLTTVIGIFASLSTAVSSLPQLVKLWKEKKAENVSFLMFAVLVIGLGLWVWYGILRKDWIIILSNGFSFFINLSAMILSIRYKSRI